MKTKFCSKCNKIKPINKFGKHKRHKDGLATICLLCEQNRRLGRYNLTLKQYKELFNIQNGCCAICNKHQSQLKHKLHVDHNHKTGIIRGLICKGCNSTLEGYIKFSKQFEIYLNTVPNRMIKFYRKWIKENSAQ